jgi:hypothetical protein
VIGATKTALSSARSATLIWLSEHPTLIWLSEHPSSSTCPTVDELKAARVLDPGFSSKDAWGMPLEIHCQGGEIYGRSAGPDRRWGTEDDLVVPSPD